MRTVLSFVNIGVLIIAGSILALMTPQVRSAAVEFIMIFVAVGMVGAGLWMFYTHPLLSQEIKA